MVGIRLQGSRRFSRCEDDEWSKVYEFKVGDINGIAVDCAFFVLSKINSAFSRRPREIDTRLRAYRGAGQCMERQPRIDAHTHTWGISKSESFAAGRLRRGR